MTATALDPPATASAQWQNISLDVEGVQLEVLSAGRGRPVVVLHDQEYLNQPWPYLDALAERFRVLVPSHPGFGRSTLPEHIDSVDDLAYVYLSLLDELDERPAGLMGMGFGGWVAAEVAVRCRHSAGRLVLVDAVGVKVSDRTTRDIGDNFLMDSKQFLAASWHDPQAGAATMKLPGPGLAEEELLTLLRNRQSAALFSWKPFMHNPKLLGRLSRIQVPTLMVWGESDGIVSPDYGRAFAARISEAEFRLISAAGHYPYLEQPASFSAAVLPFLGEARG